MKLYEIAREYRDLCDALEANESGELAEDTASRFAGLSDALEVKARNIVGLIRELKLQSDAVADESKRLMVLSQTKKNAADRLKAYLLENLVAAGVQKMDVGIAKLGVQKASRPSIAWARDGEPMPEEFERVVHSLDGDKAYDAHKAGTLPEGFTVKFTTFLSIR